MKATARKDSPSELTVTLADSMPFQEISVVNSRLEQVEQATLTADRRTMKMSLPPGDYLVKGMAPNGRSREFLVKLAAGDKLSVDTDQTRERSPHEWLTASYSRLQLPRSEMRIAALAQQIPFGVDISQLRNLGQSSSLSLPYWFSDLAGISLDLFSERFISIEPDGARRPSRAGQASVHQGELNLRSYAWSPAKGRWLRTYVIDRAEGRYAADYTQLVFPGRQHMPEELRDTIHLVGAFQSGRPAHFKALPLFSDGSELIVGREASLETLATGAEDTASERVSWRLSARDSDVDALLQALNGRTYSDREAVSGQALEFADRALHDKHRDPEAAIVAGYFLLQCRSLDARASWVKNLAGWFSWSPDALILGAWGNLLFGTGDQETVAAKLSRVYKAGPPQFAPARKLLRDMLSIHFSQTPDDSSSGEQVSRLRALWNRLGRETKREVAGGPLFNFTRNYYKRSASEAKAQKKSK